MTERAALWTWNFVVTFLLVLFVGASMLPDKNERRLQDIAETQNILLRLELKRQSFEQDSLERWATEAEYLKQYYRKLAEQ